MTLLAHRSPLGALEIPGVVGLINPGEPFEIEEDIAKSLLAQHATYRPAKRAGYAILTIPELTAIAHERGIAIKSDAKKADIITALAAADAQEASA
jgi:hypothetical protein